MVDPEEPCFPCHGSSPHGVFCSVSPNSLHKYSVRKEDSPMKYEAPKAVVVDFENDYVAAVGGHPSRTA